MSAFMVSKKTIDILVGAVALRQHGSRPSGEELNDVGRMLIRANGASMQARYGERAEDAQPNAIEMECAAYRFDAAVWAQLVMRKIPPVQVLKSAACFAYQACEVDSWNDSEARKYVEGIKAIAIQALPGYSDAKWGAHASGRERATSCRPFVRTWAHAGRAR